MRTRRRRRVGVSLLTPAAAILLAVCLCGCGSAKPLTRAQLTRRTNALCDEVHAKLKAIGPAKTPTEFAQLARKLAGFEQQELESMRKLTPPRSLAADWKQILEGVEEISIAAGTLSTELQLKHQKHAVEAFGHISKVQQQLSKIVKRDGFTSCGELA
jgi:tRNA U34 5-methylaminomethyl-2-thiouridine-forming methyltransferase MnmC